MFYLKLNVWFARYDESIATTTKYINIGALGKYLTVAKTALKVSSVEGLCFVDIGCGDGRLLQHAITKYKMIAFGIEIKEEFAQKLEANIVIGNAMNDEFSYLYKKADIIFINNYLFLDETNEGITKMIQQYCGNTIIIVTKDIFNYLNPTNKKDTWRRLHVDTSEGFDNDNYPCDWNSKLTVFFYQKPGVPKNVVAELKSCKSDTEAKYLDVRSNLRRMRKDGLDCPNSISEMQCAFPNIRQKVLRLILEDFRNEFGIPKRKTRYRSK